MGNIWSHQEPEKSDLDAFETKYEVRNRVMKYIGADDENYPRRAQNPGSSKKKRRRPSTSQLDEIAPKSPKLSDVQEITTISSIDDDPKQLKNHVPNQFQTLATPPIIQSEDAMIAHASDAESGPKTFVRPWECPNNTVIEANLTPILQADDFQGPKLQSKSPIESPIPNCERNEWDIAVFGCKKYATHETGLCKDPNVFQNDVQLSSNNWRGEFENCYENCSTWTKNTSLQERTDLSVPNDHWHVSNYPQRNYTGDIQNVNSRSSAYPKKNSTPKNSFGWNYNFTKGDDNFHESPAQNHPQEGSTWSKGYRPRGKRGGKKRNFSKSYKQDGKSYDNDETDMANMGKFVSVMMNVFKKQ